MFYVLCKETVIANGIDMMMKESMFLGGSTASGTNRTTVGDCCTYDMEKGSRLTRAMEARRRTRMTNTDGQMK